MSHSNRGGVTSSSNMQSTSHVSQLIAATRDEVRSREREASRGSVSSRSSRVSLGGLANLNGGSASARLTSSLTRGQHNRTFFADPPLFTMPPISADAQPLPVAPAGTTTPLFFKTSSQRGSQRHLNQRHHQSHLHSQASLRSGASHLHSQASLGGLSARSNGVDHDESLFSSPDIPTLVPFQPAANGASPSATGVLSSRGSSRGQLPASVFQTPYSSFGVLPTGPQQPAAVSFAPHSARALSHTPPTGPYSQQQQSSSPYPALLGPNPYAPAPPPAAHLSSQARLVRTYAPLGGGSGVTSSASLSRSSARLEVLDYLQSDSCRLFADQVQVLSTELDDLIAACGGVAPTIAALRELDSSRAAAATDDEHTGGEDDRAPFDQFAQLSEAVREQLAAKKLQAHHQQHHASAGRFTLRPQGRKQQASPREEKTQDATFMPMPPPHASSKQKSGRKTIATSGANSVGVVGVSGDSTTHSPNGGLSERDATMQRVVEFISSPSCSLFPSSASVHGVGVGGGSGSITDTDIKIEASDLAALVDCGAPRLTLMSYLHTLHRQIGEAREEARGGGGSGRSHASNTTSTSLFRATHPFRTFADLLHAVQTMHARATKKKGLVMQSASNASHVSTVNDSGLTSATASTASLAVVDPATTFAALTPRAQRFVVELTAFFRSPKCRVFVDQTPTTPTATAPSSPPSTTVRSLSTSRLPDYLVAAAEPPRPKAPVSATVDAITNEDLVSLMQVAGERELLESERLAALAASDAALEGTLESLGATARGSISAATGTSAANSHTNRALFFVSALNIAITLPQPASQPVRDWPALMSAVQLRQEQSLAMQSHLLDRLTSSSCKLFASMQVRRVPDSYSSSFRGETAEEQEERDAAATSNDDSHRSARSRSASRSRHRSRSRSRSRTRDATDKASSASLISSPIVGPTESPTESDESIAPSERLLYLSRADMSRLFFESTAGMYVESYLNSFERATPPRTFFDFNGLVFGVKVAHLLWLSQQKQEAEAAEAARATPQKSDASVATSPNSDDVALDAYRRAVLDEGASDDDSNSASTVTTTTSPTRRANKTIGTQTPLSTAPIGSLQLQSKSVAVTVPKTTPSKDEEDAAKASGSSSDALDSITLGELGVHLRSTTVQSLLFDASVLPVAVHDADLRLVLESARDLDASHDVEEEAWSEREYEARVAAREKEAGLARSQGRPEPEPIPPRERKPVVILDAQALEAQMSAEQARERSKCALLLSFLQQFEAPAMAAGVSSPTSATHATLASTVAMPPTTVAPGDTELARHVSLSADPHAPRLLAAPGFNGVANIGGGVVKFRSIAQLCDALYLEYALHRSREDALAFLRSSACRLLPEGTAPAVAIKENVGGNASSAATTAATSKLQSLTTGGPSGTISAADVAHIYRQSRAGLYTLPILAELNNEHLRAFDLDSLVSMVSGHHTANLARIKSQKFLLLTHLSGNKCRIFPQAVRVTDAHLDLLLTTTRNSGSAALYYLHHLTRHRRTFASMDEVLGSVRYLLAHPSPFKDRLKQLVASPMCIVMNKQKERLLPTDAVIDRLWEAQQAGVDAIAHVQALHADAQGFASYADLVTTVGANHASARSSQQETEKWMLLTHLVSPLNTLFAHELYDVTITPKHMDALLAAGGGSASVVLYHLEHLDEPAPTGSAHTFDGMPPLMARVAETQTAVRAHDERLRAFLNSRACHLFGDSNVLGLRGPQLDEAAIDRLLNEGGASAAATLHIVHSFNSSDPPRVFTDLTALIAAVRRAASEDPRIPGRTRNSLNNFGQPRDLTTSADTVALPPAEPVRFTFPAPDTAAVDAAATTTDAKPASTEAVVSFASSAAASWSGPVGTGGFVVDVPSVTGPFYSDGSMALDAEEGVAGNFVVDPNQLYGDGEGGAASGMSSPQQRESRPPSAMNGFSASPPPATLSPPPPPIDEAMLEADRELVVDYLNSRCSLFRDAEPENLEVTQAHVDDAIAIAGGGRGVLLELTRMDAIGRQFDSFEALLGALAEACRDSRRIERSISTYRHPEEAQDDDARQDRDESEAGDRPADLPASVQQSGASALAVHTVGGGLNGVGDGDSLGDGGGNSPPSLFRSSSINTQNNNLSRALSIARALAAGGELTGDAANPEYQFTDADREAVREAVRDADVLRDAQATARTSSPSAGVDLAASLDDVATNQLLVIGGGLAQARVHLARFAQAHRQIGGIGLLARSVEESRATGVYSSNAELTALESFLSSPARTHLHTFLASTEIGIPFRELPRPELDLWLRTSQGRSELERRLDLLAKHNQRIVDTTSGRVDETGLKVPPALLMPRTPEELASLLPQLDRAAQAARARDLKLAAHARKQARGILRDFLGSSACYVLSPAAVLAKTPTQLCTNEQADAILDALTPNTAAVRDDPETYRPTEADLEAVIERLCAFDSVGRKFPHVAALATACRVAYAEPNAPPTTNAGDNIPGAHSSATQRRILFAYLTSDACGLLPTDARRQLEALSGTALDELVSAAIEAARAHRMQPLALGRGAALPRYVTPLYRLQQRSTSGGSDEYKTVSDVIGGLRAMSTESPLPTADVSSAIEYLTSDSCGLFSQVSSDSGLLDLHESDVEDLLRLVGSANGGDCQWATTRALLDRFDACGVKFDSVRSLIQKAQRSLTFDFVSSEVERRALLAFLRSDDNRVVEFVQDQTLTEQECDELLLQSEGGGARFLIDVVFARLAKEFGTKATDTSVLAKRITLPPGANEEPAATTPIPATAAVAEPVTEVTVTPSDAPDSSVKPDQDVPAEVVPAEDVPAAAEAAAPAEPAASSVPPVEDAPVEVTSAVVAASAATTVPDADVAEVSPSAVSSAAPDIPAAAPAPVEPVEPELPELTTEQRQSLLEYLLDEHTHLFAAHGVSRKQEIVDAASGQDLARLVDAGQGLTTLLPRLTYLDTIGSRFQSIAEVRKALTPLRDQPLVTEADRTALIEFLGASECQLFASSAEQDDTMEVSAAEIDAMILCKGGIDGCLAALRTLERDGQKVQRLDQLLGVLLGLPAGADLLGADSASPSHQLILEYLSSEHIGLFSPLAVTGAELEITDQDLDRMIASTGNDVQLALEVLKMLDAQQRGFTDLVSLAKAVEEEFPAMQAHIASTISL